MWMGKVTSKGLAVASPPAADDMRADSLAADHGVDTVVHVIAVARNGEDTDRRAVVQISETAMS